MGQSVSGSEKPWLNPKMSLFGLGQWAYIMGHPVKFHNWFFHYRNDPTSTARGRGCNAIPDLRCILYAPGIWCLTALLLQSLLV